MRSGTRWAPAALALAALGCAAGVRAPETAPGGPPATGDEHRALVLLMEDRRLFDPFSADRVAREAPELRPALARALGRIGDRRALPLLEELLIDGPSAVRRAAAFALGLLGDPAAVPLLEAAARDADTETGRRAVEALARLGVPLAKAEAALDDLPGAERDARLLPSLFRFPPPQILPLARRAVATAEHEALRHAGYALARNPLPEARPELRTLVAAADPWLRGWAARALGEVGDGSDLARLRPLLDEPEPGPPIQALRAARRLVADGRAAAPESWIGRLLELYDDPRPGVRIGALEASSAWLRDPRLGPALGERARRGEPWERQVALAALAAGAEPEAEALAEDAAARGDAPLRAAAAAAAAELGRQDLVERLAADDDARVRLAALAAALERLPGAAGRARRALRDADPAVRGAALEWLVENPEVDSEALMGSVAAEGGRLPIETRVAWVEALVARARAEPLERGVLVELLEDLAASADYLIRRQAAAGLERLERPPPPVGAVDTGLDLGRYRDLVRLAEACGTLRLATPRGELAIRLDCAVAPLAGLNAIRLARQGFYDGLLFHRVVPDFVVQGGDPRGDGWGGPGYTLRDEVGPLPFRRGAVGMARAGPDTGGSQLFVTLSPQPHLEGAYTLFGYVVEGDEVLDRIRQGDPIERAWVEP